MIPDKTNFLVYIYGQEEKKKMIKKKLKRRRKQEKKSRCSCSEEFYQDFIYRTVVVSPAKTLFNTPCTHYVLDDA